MKAKKLLASVLAAVLALSSISAFAAEEDAAVNGWTQLANSADQKTTLTAVGTDGVKVSGQGGFLLKDGGVVGAQTPAKLSDFAFTTEVKTIGGGATTDELIIGAFAKEGGAFAEGQAGLFFEFAKNGFGRELAENEYSFFIKTKTANADPVIYMNSIVAIDFGADKTIKLELKVEGDKLKAYLDGENVVGNVSHGEDGKPVGTYPLEFNLADVGLTEDCYFAAEGLSAAAEFTNPGAFEFTCAPVKEEVPPVEPEKPEEKLWNLLAGKDNAIEKVGENGVKLTGKSAGGVGVFTKIADLSKAKYEIKLDSFSDVWTDVLTLGLFDTETGIGSPTGFWIELRKDFPKGDGTYGLGKNVYAVEFKTAAGSVTPVGMESPVVCTVDLGDAKTLTLSFKDNGDGTFSPVFNGSSELSNIADVNMKHEIKLDKAALGYANFKYFSLNGWGDNGSKYVITITDKSAEGGNEPGGNEPGGNEPGGNKPGGNEPVKPEEPKDPYNGWNVFTNSDATATGVGTNGIRFKGYGYLLDGKTVGGSVKTSVNNLNYKIKLDKLGDGSNTDVLVLCFGTEKGGLVPENKGFYIKLAKTFPGFDLGKNEYSVEIMSYDSTKNGNGYITPVDGPSFIGKIDLGSSNTLRIQLKKSGNNFKILFNGKSELADISNAEIMHNTEYAFKECDLPTGDIYFATQAFTQDAAKAKTSEFDFTVTDMNKNPSKTSETTNTLFVISLIVLAAAGTTVVLTKKRRAENR